MMDTTPAFDAQQPPMPPAGPEGMPPMPGGPDAGRMPPPPPEGQPESAYDLEDFSAVQHKDEAALLYALGIIHAVEEDGKFYYKPQTLLTKELFGDMIGLAITLGSAHAPRSGPPHPEPAIIGESKGIHEIPDVPIETLADGVGPLDAQLTRDGAARLLFNAMTCGVVSVGPFGGFPNLILVSETTKYDELTILDTDYYTAPAGKRLIMKANGVVQHIKPGTWQNVELIVKS